MGLAAVVSLIYFNIYRGGVSHELLTITTLIFLVLMSLNNKIFKF